MVFFKRKPVKLRKWGWGCGTGCEADEFRSCRGMEEVRRTGSREGLPYVGGECGGAGRMEESSLKPANVERGCLSLEETSRHPRPQVTSNM